LPLDDTAAGATGAPAPGWRRLAKLLGVMRLVRVLLFGRFDRRVLRPVLGYVRSLDPEFASLLAGVRAPVLVLAARPAEGTTSRYQRLAECMPDARFEALGDSHHLHREHPQRFVERAAAFLAPC
jgi:pimeloyl-ACP methyl ester carboxylesterase